MLRVEQRMSEVRDAYHYPNLSPTASARAFLRDSG